LNYIFIPRYGFVAAAYTTLLSFVILAIMQFSFVKYLRQGKELLDDKFLWGISFLVVIFSLVSNILYFNNYLRYVFILVVIAGTLKMKSKIIISLKQILKR
jgi:O-antigen/teichoic acid export membrane protein